MGAYGDAALSRGDFLQAGAAAGLVGAGPEEARQTAQARPADLKFRWYGGGVYELASPDDKSIVLVDAWIWNNLGYNRFPGLTKPPELAAPAAYADYIKARNPQAVLVALTHDHADHIGNAGGPQGYAGDYFEVLRLLGERGVNVKTVGQSDLLRAGLLSKFQAAGLDPAKMIVNGGAGTNMGGVATHGEIRTILVPAVHSTFLGFPSAGFIIEMAGIRIYASGDTDLFGDMALIRERYRPDLAVVSAGNGPYTMGPADAAEAVKLTGAAHAIPVHYAHNAQVLGPEAEERFREAMTRIAPRTRVSILKPGEATTLKFA
ncbi:MAG: MBL fold metallo-hydrolase [Candidatus Eremiobacteraeota bacterium]|nr:MBL fold metallo-hydrolase [Candidatus Eremiobacteraeota bacterium]MBV8353900.1 MBL fold metallo-hydrolase [Candidatus Eremiobacteraeota bacterium]